MGLFIIFFKVMGGGFGDFDRWVRCFVKGDVDESLYKFLGCGVLFRVVCCWCKGDCKS